MTAWPLKFDRAEMARLLAEGLPDRAIARRLGVCRSAISRARRQIGRPANPPPRAPRPSRARPFTAAEIATLRALAAAGHGTGVIAERLRRGKDAIARERARLGLPPGRPGGRPRLTIDVDALDHLRAMHADGKGDGAIAEALGLSLYTVARHRRVLGLAANRGTPRRRPAVSAARPGFAISSATLAALVAAFVARGGRVVACPPALAGLGTLRHYAPAPARLSPQARRLAARALAAAAPA